MPLTQAIVAEHLDLSQPAVSALLVRLGLDLTAATLDEIRVAYIRTLRRSAAGRGSANLADERLLLVTAHRQRAELELRLRSADLCEVEPVLRTVTNLAAGARQAFERIPDKLADRLAVSTNPDDISALLSAEIDLVLADLANAARGLRLGQSDPTPAKSFYPVEHNK